MSDRHDEVVRSETSVLGDLLRVIKGQMPTLWSAVCRVSAVDAETMVASAMAITEFTIGKECSIEGLRQRRWLYPSDALVTPSNKLQQEISNNVWRMQTSSGGGFPSSKRTSRLALRS